MHNFSKTKIIFLFLSALSTTFLLHDKCFAIPTDPYIIWKFDDLRDYSWQDFKRAADIVVSAGGKCSIGIFAWYLENGSGSDYNNYVSSCVNGDKVEIWMHGYNYVNESGENGYEFFGTPYAYQKKHFDLAINALLVHNDFLLRTFSGHYWGDDATTVQVFNENPYMLNFLWPQTAGVNPDKMFATYQAGQVSLEVATGSPDYNRFLTRYTAAAAGAPYIILQCHPWGFSDYSTADGDGWVEFGKIVDYLTSRNAKYTTPWGYYKIAKSITDTTPPPTPTGLSLVRVSSTGVQATWTAAVDNESVVDAYKLYRNNVFVGVSSTTFFVDIAASNLPDSTGYRVACVNRANLKSNWSPALTLAGATSNCTLTTAVSPSGAGTVALSPAGGSYTTGTTVTVTATANSGYTFTSWTGAATGTTNPVTVTMDSDKTVTATFSGGVTTSYTLTTSVSPSGTGTVTLSPTGTYTAGTTVTVTATAASGYTFTSWTGDASGTSSPVIVTMNANKTVTATFTQIPIGSYTLSTTVSPTAGGTITLSPTGGVYTAGTSVQVTATVNSGYTFTSWTGGATGTSNPVTVTVNADKAVTATFTASAVPVLSVTPATLDFGTMAIDESKSLTLNITNTGGGTLSGTISTDQSWFIVSPLSFSGATTITVTANTAGLTAGQTYTGTITITSSGGNSSISVTMATTAGETAAEVTPYPNPFVTAENTDLKFKGTGANPLDSGTEVKIYTMTGKLVRSLQKAEGASGDISWDGMDDSGSNVVSGIYLYVVNGTDKKSTGRIAVIR